MTLSKEDADKVCKLLQEVWLQEWLEEDQYYWPVLRDLAEQEWPEWVFYLDDADDKVKVRFNLRGAVEPT